jgi:nucleotide-binding universal stress UspA family protein
MYRHILLPTDGSELSKEAVRHGVQLARENGAKITFLNVVMPFHVVATTSDSLSDTRPEYEKHARQHAERLLGECQRAAKQAGVPSEGAYMVNEHPYEEIVKAAQDADLIVMASHGRKGVKGLLLGSETHKTITHGHTPVLVIR